MSRDPIPSAFAAEVNNLLLRVARTLTQSRPDEPMDEETRLTLARTYAERRYGTGYSIDRATAAERSMLVLAPAVRVDQTRAEYGTLLRLIVQGVTAR